MNLTDEKILSILNENVEKKISSTIAALKAENYISPEDKINAQELINNFARAVKSSTEDIDASKIQAEFENIFKSKVDIASQLKNWLEIDNKFLQREIDNFVDKKINEFIPENERPMPFKNMIYFGDGETDIPSMKMIKVRGGHSIAVYKPGDKAKKAVAEKLIRENRANFACPANYCSDKSLFKIVKRILDKIKADDDFNRLLKVNKNRIINNKNTNIG